MASIPQASQYGQSSVGNIQPNTDRAHRSSVCREASAAADELYARRTTLREKGEVHEVRDINIAIGDVSKKVIAFLLMEMKNAHTSGDLNWIVGQLFRFCRKNAWDCVYDVAKNVQAEYVWRKLTMAADTKENLESLIAKAVEFGIKEVIVPEVNLGKPIHKLSIHPNGKANMLSRAEIEKRRMANRAQRLSKQPNKGKSDPVDKHGSKGGKKGK